jgi:Cu/Ag efflux protein CusF
MTMSFKAKTPTVLAKWKEGDKIRFRAADVGGVLTVVSIEAAK